MSEQTRSDEHAVRVDELAELEARASRAPWAVQNGDKSLIYGTNAYGGFVADTGQGYGAQADAAFIAAARNALPSLLAENESLRAQVADLQAQNQQLRLRVEGMTAEAALHEDSRDRLVNERNLATAMLRSANERLRAVEAVCARLAALPGNNPVIGQIVADIRSAAALPAALAPVPPQAETED